jgi:hypothetical protein
MSRRGARSATPEGDVILDAVVVHDARGELTPPLSLGVSRGESVAFVDDEGAGGGQLLWSIGGLAPLESGVMTVFGAPARSDDARGVVGIGCPRFSFTSGLTLVDHLRLVVQSPLLGDALSRLNHAMEQLPSCDLWELGEDLAGKPRTRLLWSLVLGIARRVKLLGVDLTEQGGEFDGSLEECLRQQREAGTVLMLALRSDSPLLPLADRVMVRTKDRWRES